MITRILKPGDRIKLKLGESADGEYQSSGECSAHLVEIVDEHWLRIGAVKNNGRPYLPDGGERFNMFFTASDGGYGCKGEVQDCINKQGETLVEVKLLTELQGDTRRKYTRVDKIIPITFSLIRTGNLKEADRGVITNISAGGMKFGSSFSIERDEIIEINLKLEESDSATQRLCGRIIYAESTANRNMRYEYRVEFLDVTQDIREKIIKFVFREERRIRNQKM